MNKVIVYFFSFLVFQACGQRSPASSSSEIVNVVGEIFPDEKLDDPNFKICHDQRYIVQYYAFSEKTYEGEKPAIVKYFQENFVAVNREESGLVRIRFVVNCKGETGRFRLLAMDPDYQPKEFDKAITDQLLSLTKSLEGWKAMKGSKETRDYYQYLIFKIEKGQLIEILP